MKKGLSKSISSPGRTDKFPPPLMRFLRSNVGSKSSRGRTRASPMFMRKNKHVTIETTQEPSSPKVTCIGQVRVRRSSKGSRNCSIRRLSSERKQQHHQRETKPKRSRCCNFSVKLHNPKSLLSVFKKLVCCFPFEHCGKKVESTQRVRSQVSTSSTSTTESIENVVAVTGNKESFVSSISNPPKDALILTRCRSAPYRSSSLASRLWGSPLNHTSPKSQSPQKHIQVTVLENPISPKGENGDLEFRKSQESEEMQSSINEGSSKEEEKNGEGAYVHPLLLTRCKSEPARTGERLNPRRFSELDSRN